MSEAAGIDERLSDTGIDAGKAQEDTQNTDTALKSNIKLLAVTSCPTGIAHTYMAAEGLEKAAKAAGVAIKIETRGSGGAKNVIDRRRKSPQPTASSLQRMHRYRWTDLTERNVISCQVSDGINKADELIAESRCR